MERRANERWQRERGGSRNGVTTVRDDDITDVDGGD